MSVEGNQKRAISGDALSELPLAAASGSGDLMAGHEKTQTRSNVTETASPERGVYGLFEGQVTKTLDVRFSVLIPVFNREDYVRQTIDSVLSQTFSNYEVFAIDDGSTDGSLAILESYGAKIKIIRQKNQGPEVARNNAAAQARGEYLAMLDHDDVLLPSALATYDQIIRQCDSPPLIIGKMFYLQHEIKHSENAETEPQIQILRYADYLSKDRHLGHTNSQIVIKKSVFDEVGGYSSLGIKPAPDDVQLILTIGSYGPCIAVLKPDTVGYRLHPTQGIENAEAIAKGILRLAEFERQNKYPGGRKRKAARYALIGGLAANYALRFCWAKRRRRTAVRLLWGTAPMVFGAVRNRLFRSFRTPSQPIFLAADSNGVLTPSSSSS